MQPVTLTHRAVPFSAVKIGQDFLWGSYYLEKQNWGRKRSSRTADWRPLILGKLSDHTDWSYWRQNETVYVTP